MPQYRMVVQRKTEEQFEFTLDADSAAHAHQEMRIPGKLDQLESSPVSREKRVSVIDCHRVDG